MRRVIPVSVLKHIRRFLAQSPRVLIASDVSLETAVTLRPGRQDGHAGTITIGRSCTLDTGVVLDAWGGSISLDPNVFIGPYTVIYGHGGITIGEHCLIAMHCRILSSEHTLSPIGVPIRSQPDILKPTCIGRDVWLGAGVTVLGGITLGNGCVIGAGAVVTQDIPADAIAVGVPARVIGRRPKAS